MMMPIKTIYRKLIAATRKLRDVEKEYNSLKHEVADYKAQMLNELHEIGSTTYNGSLGRVTIYDYEVPVITDWDALYRHIVATNSFDLLHRRVTAQAWRERLEDGKEVPGIEATVIQRVNVTPES